MSQIDPLSRLIRATFVVPALFRLPCRACGGDGLVGGTWQGQIEYTEPCGTCAGTGYVEREGAPV